MKVNCFTTCSSASKHVRYENSVFRSRHGGLDGVDFWHWNNGNSNSFNSNN
jgi:hypothetical protein